MAIMVQYQDKSYGFEENRMLDELIMHKRIFAFRRASGWAEIGRDPVRRACADEKFDGVERRVQAGATNCLACSHSVGTACRQDDCLARISSQATTLESSKV